MDRLFRHLFSPGGSVPTAVIRVGPSLNKAGRASIQGAYFGWEHTSLVV
jgi:hypothetical protein